MGTDAIIYSVKKKLGCDIDRAYNIVGANDDYATERKFSEDGLSPGAAIYFINSILTEPMDEDDDRPDLFEARKYWLSRAMAFIKTLDADDVVKFCDEYTDEWSSAWTKVGDDFPNLWQPQEWEYQEYIKNNPVNTKQ